MRRGGLESWAGDVIGVWCLDGPVHSLTKKRPKKLVKIQTSATNPGLESEVLPSRGEIQPWQEDQRSRILKTVADNNWGESGKEKVERASIPGSQIQQPWSGHWAQRDKKVIGPWDQLLWKLWAFLSFFPSHDYLPIWKMNFSLICLWRSKSPCLSVKSGNLQ